MEFIKKSNRLMIKLSKEKISDDIVSKEAVVAIVAKSVVKLVFLALALAILIPIQSRLISVAIITTLTWIVSGLVFVFLPNLIRHKKRWALNYDYRKAVLIKSNEIGALNTIYSDLLDDFPT